MPPAPAAPRPLGLPRIELRIERLRATFRFTFAFHAREVRFERDLGHGFEGLFPETFSFHADRHDPTELYLQLEDLWSSPRLLAPGANRRDAEDLTRRFLTQLPACLEGALDRLQGDTGSEVPGRACEDVALLAHVAMRFLADKQLEDHPQVRFGALHLRKIAFRAVSAVAARRVRPEFIERYLAGEAELDTEREFGAYYALAGGDAEAIDRTVMGSAERAFHRWLEDVCLDESNHAFESESSPFADRGSEVLAAVAADGRGPVVRGREVTVFLRRPRNRDCARLLEKLERWFLRQYDIHHGAVMLNLAARLARGEGDADRVMSWHSRRTYLAMLLIPSLPFLVAIFAYRRWKDVLDVWATAQVMLVMAVALWLFVYRFLWRRDLTFFHAAVPRIAAGIIVGYLPLFLVDEVWDLAGQSFETLATVVVMLGAPTLLYLYVEVERRLRDPGLAFRRAVDVFLLGLIQAAAFGLVATSLLGPLMTGRNWHAHQLQPIVGQLPRILGLEPFEAFPTAVVLMSFLAFFIGTFLQLLWEELPITEPM
jgi:hypothetical protein